MRIIRNEDDIETGLRALVELDPRLVPIVEKAGPVPLRLNDPGFAGLASIVVSQMISRASAEAIWKRIAAVGPVTAETYAGLDPATIAGFGLSRAKAATLQALSTAIFEERFDPDRLCRLETADAIRAMTALPGIGPWTAEVYLMFCGGHMDIFPVKDVALQAAVGHAFGMDSRPAAKELAQISSAWSPWRSVAARLFWAYYACVMRRAVTPII